MRTVSLKNALPYAEATLNVAPWYLRACADQYRKHGLSKEQLFVRDVVEVASNISIRRSMCDYLRSQRSYPIREMIVADPMLHHFVTKVLNHDHVGGLIFDKFAHYAASLPFRFMRVVMHEDMKSKRGPDKLPAHTIATMSIFPLRTAFRSFAIMGLYANQAFDPQLCTSFESDTSVPMSAALSGLAKGYAKRSNYELLAAAMMIASGDGYLDAARGVKHDPMMQECYAANALHSFGWATVFSLRVGENAHGYSPTILDTLQRYAGYMQNSIKKWQDKA